MCIPWGANAPRHIRIAWVLAEFIKYMGIFSHERFYLAASRRLIDALNWLYYPKHVIQSVWISWIYKEKYARLKRALPLLQEDVLSFLSQVFLKKWRMRMQGMVGGRFFRARVIGVSHHGGVLVSWAREIHLLRRRLRFINGRKIFAVLRPMKNLKSIFCGKMKRPLTHLHQP